MLAKSKRLNMEEYYKFQDDDDWEDGDAEDVDEGGEGGEEGGADDDFDE
jgi:hypothetical protein